MLKRKAITSLPTHGAIVLSLFSFWLVCKAWIFVLASLHYIVYERVFVLGPSLGLVKKLPKLILFF